MRAILVAPWLAAAIVGCPAAPTPACAPGRVLDCPGPGGCSGAQRCLDDGSGFGACECIDGMDASMADAPIGRDAPEPFDAPLDGGDPDDAGLDAEMDAPAPDAEMDAPAPDAGTDAPCTRATCAELPGMCGTLPDGCGGTITCNPCSLGQVCGADGRCCTRRTCTGSYPGMCGMLPDGCGGMLTCNTCSLGQVCGTDGRCCTRRTCGTSYPGMCGTFSDGCGSTIRCSVPGCDAG